MASASFPAASTSCNFAPGLPVPHMGWNQLAQTKPDPLLDGVSSLDYVYFVHGYAVPAGELHRRHHRVRQHTSPRSRAATTSAARNFIPSARA